ncbi:histidine phosphatase family protein [Staphylococcus capitis]|uniref:histidine phosphatase family protein n=1 Tax=Staphylococcus capitis TaxID=29388 RepID=UPI001D13285E|nr:histidine phosphatase family protein [Staphylococcus capitis]MCC3756375.1 histidine phosphatase family protein [Staphylococcus capitis]MDH8730453.1 histidine phosphatase family protein [Staphylococcus capitis]MDH8923087.1 histidine phosphatase family protein [Staphylococcus capitis]MDH8944041.1 histidine phosphatase family protein [Staphylococcus capitis]MDH9593109.1 histidine phosphatase family protein [Staphylococcus capitis]
MNIYLVRHGESQSNYDNKHGKPYFCGQLDVSLTKKGMQSAQDLVTYFTNKKIGHVYVSDLLRTQQTYEGIFPYNIPTTFTKSLRERSLGVFEGKNKQEVSEDVEYERYFNDPEFKDFRHSFSQKAPEGESYQDVYERIEHFFNEELNHDDENIVIIAHQVVIRCIFVYLGELNKEDALDAEIKNCYPYLVHK